MKQTQKLTAQEIHETNTPVYDARREIATKIIQNLKEYGDLSAPNFYGRPYNAGTKANGMFTGANYLRFLADHDPETDSIGYVSEEWLQQQFPGIPNPPWLRENAKPLKMERWETVDVVQEETEIDAVDPAYLEDKAGAREVLNKKAAIGHLMTFYNIDDLLHITASLPRTRRVEEHDTSMDFEYAEDLLESIGIERLPDRVRTIDEIKDVIFDHAKQFQCSDLSAAMTVHLFCRDCHLTPPANLFTEEMIAAMEANYAKMFSSMRTASKVTYHIRNAEQKEHDKLKEEVNQIMEDKAMRMPSPEGGLFNDLSIKFQWAEDFIYDIDGNEFQPYVDPSSEERHSGIYKGEEAYKFLAAVARYDKDQYNRRHSLSTMCTKLEMTVSSSIFSLSDMRIDLGDLELGNKNSVVDAFEERILQFYYNLVESPETCKYSILKNYTEDGTTLGKLKISEEELDAKITEHQQKIADLISEMKAYFERLRQDEAKFIEKNPAFKEYNSYKASTYKYLVKKSFLEYVDSLPMNGREHGLYFRILDKHDLPANGSFAYMDLQELPWHQSAAIGYTGDIKGFNNDDYVMVDVYERADDVFGYLDSYRYRNAAPGNSSHINDVKILFTSDEVTLAQRLDDIKYEREYVPTNPYRDSFDATENSLLTGFEAICQARYDYEKNIIPERAGVYEKYYNDEDLRWVDHFYLNPKFNGHFTINGEKQPACEFSENQGQLRDKSFTDNFISPEKLEEFNNLYAFAGKYYYSYNSMSDMAQCFKEYAHRRGAQPIDADFNSKVDLDKELEIHQARYPDIDISKSKLSSLEIGELADYYKQSVSLSIGDKEATLNACNALAVKMMIEDGLSNSKINTVFSCLQGRIHTTKAEFENKMPLSKILNSVHAKQLRKDMQQKPTESIFNTPSR